MKIVTTVCSHSFFRFSRPHGGCAGQISKAHPHSVASSSRCYSKKCDNTNASSLSSTRGRAAVALLPSYLADARVVERYSPSNSSGALQLGVAESQMMEDWLVPALNAHPVVSADAIYYQPTAGREDFKQSFAAYIEDLCSLERGRLQQEGLIVGAGCNAVLENLCFTLADAGDSVLIPTPYYAAFEFDLVARAGLTVQPVTTEAYHPKCTGNDGLIDPKLYYPNSAALDAAYNRAKEQGGTPKILLISHPMNPLGICYPSDTVKECLDWCRNRKVHLICDEIYAGSVYRGEGFCSALKLAGQELGPYVHWVYALSKDFALSGLRVGAAYTENSEIMVPMQKLNDLCQISSQTQLWTAATLQRRIGDDNELWTTVFRTENHKRLDERCSALTAVLDQYTIPYLPAQAGLFVWIDLSQFLPVTKASPADRERALYLELVQEFGILLTPGNSMRNERPGFFRCVFTAASDDEFAIALQRIEKFCQAKVKAS
jgi:aspartate/methionine/tyrosine aminotransferase